MRIGVRACLALLSLAACTAGEPTAPITRLPRDLSPSESRLIASGNSFSFALLRETLAREPADSNVFISPLSVAMALGMTYNGADGATATAFEQALQLSGLSREQINASFQSLIALLRGLDPTVTFRIANSIWNRQDFVFDPAFFEVSRTYYDAAVQELDFASPSAAPTINAWVNEATAGRIPRIVPDNIPDDIIMYLINAIYFKGDWTHRFDAARTSAQPFQLEGGGTVQVPLMTHGAEVPVRMAADDLVEVLDLPYGGGAYRMTVVLPVAGRSLHEVTAQLDQGRWEAWIAALDSTEMTVFLPKFTLRYDLDAADAALKALGLAPAYCDASPAPDFTRMDPSGRACVSEVKHRTFVLVDEEGTEAAAVTSVGVGVTSLPPQFRVDRPFLFAIRERLSGTVLFIGRVMNPVA
jgi:serpin B